tara:strand:- start:837 stop:1598 length:762 start_codon:yes stop_codon:yes gene_type:complete
MFSYLAIFTIVKYRLREFAFEYHYSILAPIINNLLFIFIFATIDRYYFISNNNVSFIQFIIPGLILMIISQESFDNPSASLINSKQIGSFEDFLIAPVSRLELYFSYLISQIIIGIFLAFLNFFVLLYFFDFSVFSFFYFLYYISLTIIFFSNLGCLIGFLAYNWDTQSTISSFFVAPINFLSGTFFAISSLPENLRFIFYYNPYYYLVTFFRDSFYTNFEYNVFKNLMIIVLVFSSILVTGYIFYKGYKVIK